MTITSLTLMALAAAAWSAVPVPALLAAVKKSGGSGETGSGRKKPAPGASGGGKAKPAGKAKAAADLSGKAAREAASASVAARALANAGLAEAAVAMEALASEAAASMPKAAKPTPRPGGVWLPPGSTFKFGEPVEVPKWRFLPMTALMEDFRARAETTGHLGQVLESARFWKEIADVGAMVFSHRDPRPRAAMSRALRSALESDPSCMSPARDGFWAGAGLALAEWSDAFGSVGKAQRRRLLQEETGYCMRTLMMSPPGPRDGAAPGDGFPYNDIGPGLEGPLRDLAFDDDPEIPEWGGRGCGLGLEGGCTVMWGLLGDGEYDEPTSDERRASRVLGRIAKKQEEAERLRDAYELLEEESPGSPEAEETLGRLADTLAAAGEWVEAAERYSSLMGSTAGFAAAGTERGFALESSLGHALAQSGSREEAVPVLRRAAEGLEASLGAGHDLAVECRIRLADALAAAGAPGMGELSGPVPQEDRDLAAGIYREILASATDGDGVPRPPESGEGGADIRTLRSLKSRCDAELARRRGAGAGPGGSSGSPARAGGKVPRAGGKLSRAARKAAGTGRKAAGAGRKAGAADGAGREGAEYGESVATVLEAMDRYRREIVLKLLRNQDCDNRMPKALWAVLVGASRFAELSEAVYGLDSLDAAGIRAKAARRVCHKDPECAARLRSRAAGTARRLMGEDSPGFLSLLEDTGAAWLSAGQHLRAAASFGRLWKIRAAEGDAREASRALTLLAGVFEASGRGPVALELHRKALEGFGPASGAGEAELSREAVERLGGGR
ncbi:MAG: hypothetical protein LBT40_02515 [Deltaproteobacteria bacterium]|jgi:tetratricopeptide (TPR) repeat protein|nr:hypothetical protein [Deltaproteobacteria bacterium]